MIKTDQEIFEIHLKNFSEDVINIIQENFKKRKSMDPVVFTLNLDKSKLAIGLIEGLGKFFISDAGKNAASQLIKELSTKMRPLAIAFAYEGWQSTIPVDDYHSIIDEKGNYREGVLRPSEDSQSKEVVVVHLETFNKSCDVVFEIIRTGGEITLSEIVKQNWAPKDLKVESRFGNLLQDNYSELALLIKEQAKTNMN